MDLTDQSAYVQLIHDIMGGTVRRHTFTRVELDLLLDVQAVRMRKTAKTEMLRRYLRSVQQQFAAHASDPLGFASFSQAENEADSSNAAPRPTALQARTAVPV
jgi:hypothetical protein